jgi:dUTP pyrophosphatase
MYLLKIKIIDISMVHFYQYHRHAYISDSGIDIFFSENVIIPPKTFGNKIKTGIKMELINLKENEESPYIIAPRSSIYKTPLRPSQSISIIDVGFRGEIHIFVDNWFDNEYHIKKGDRLFQVINPSLKSMHLKIVHDLSVGIRKNNGLGSSGQHIMAKL